MSCFIDDDSLSPLSNGNIKEDMQFWINQFLEQKEFDRVAAKTLKSYRNALDTFMYFVSKYEINNNMKTIGAKFINRYLIEYQALLATKKIDKLKKKNILDGHKKYEKIIEQQNEKFLGKNDANFEILHEFDNSIEHRLTVVKMLLKYISDNNEDDHDYTPLFRKFAIIRIKDKFTKYITIEEMDEVISFMIEWPSLYKQYLPKSSERIAYRDSLLLLLYTLTGARSEEVVKIKLEDLTLFEYGKSQYYSIKIQEGKGGKIREIAVESGFIKKHIEFFEKELPDSSYYLSSTFKNKCYTGKNHHEDNIRKFGNFILAELKINKTGLHTFRRGYATKRVMYDKVELSLVAAELGNSSHVLEKYYLKHESRMSIKEL